MGLVRSNSSQRGNSVECYLVLISSPPALVFIVVSGADQIGPRRASPELASPTRRDEDALKTHRPFLSQYSLLLCLRPWDHGMGPWVHGLNISSSLARQPFPDLGSRCRLTARDEHTLTIHKLITMKARYVLSYYTLLLCPKPWDHGMGPWVHGLNISSSLTRYQMTSVSAFTKYANNKH